MKPPEYAIRLLQVAEDDLREIINYIALDNTTTATALLDKIENSLSGLISFPLLGKNSRRRSVGRHGISLPYGEKLSYLLHRGGTDHLGASNYSWR